jgi:hypothetical protein
MHEHRDEYVRHAASQLNADKRLKELTWRRNQLSARIIEHDFRLEMSQQRSKEHTRYIFERFRTEHEQSVRGFEAQARDTLQQSLEDAGRLRAENAELRAKLHQVRGF